MVTSESTRVRSDLQYTHVPFPALTIEIALYAALAFAALVIRLLALDAAPLAPDEALQGLASWNFINGHAFASTPSPLLFTGNALLFALTGAHDIAVRLLPALFGTALVLLPGLMRRELGATGAFFASALLVFSPSLVFFSRDGSGVVIAVTCALAALVFGWRYLQDRHTWYLYTGAAAAALALLAAREVWTIVLAIAIAIMVWMPQWRMWTAQAEQSDGPGHTAELERNRYRRRNAGVIFLVVLLFVATAFMLDRDGIGATFDLFGAWLRGLVPGGSLLDPLRLLIVYEPLALVFGVAALVDVVMLFKSPEQGHVVRGALTLWAITAFVLYSIGGDKNPERVVVIVVPLILLAGWYIGAWVERVATEYGEFADGRAVLLTQEMPVLVFSLALSAFLYLVMAEFATRGSVLAADMLAAMLRLAPTPTINGIVMVALIAVALAAIAFLASTTLGWERARHVGLALALILFVVWSVRQTALTSFSGEWNAQEWLIARATPTNVRDLVYDLEDLSRWRANDSYTLNLVVDRSTGPVVQWYLRDFRNARFESYPQMAPDTQALVAAPNVPVNGANLMRQRYRLEAVQAAAPDNFVQWLIFRQGGTVSYSEVVLWAPQPH